MGYRGLIEALYGIGSLTTVVVKEMQQLVHFVIGYKLIFRLPENSLLSNVLSRNQCCWHKAFFPRAERLIGESLSQKSFSRRNYTRANMNSQFHDWKS